MLMLVDCSNCHTPLQLPTGARSIVCPICQAITGVSDPRSLPPPPPTQPYATSSNHYYVPPPSPHTQPYATSSNQHYAPPPPPQPYATSSNHHYAPPPLPPTQPYATSSNQHYAPPPTQPYATSSNHHYAPPPTQPYATSSNQHYPPPPPPTQPYATSSNYHYVPPPPPPTAHHSASFGQTHTVNGRKKAVICGILYKRTKHELKGCINDATCMKYLLINKFKFPESSILMLTEEETDPYRIPTKHNIRLAMYWLVQGCQAGDSLVFYFSGHSSRQRNYTGDEIDGYDETLCPLDYKTQGVIVDDEINATMVKPLPHGVRLHAIIDACHSGTMLDLPFLCRMDRSGRYLWEDHRPQTGIFKGTNGGEVISFSGCDDHQSSADTASLSKVTSTGAMTFSFIQAIERGHGTTYGDILSSMRTTIQKNESDVGGGTGGGGAATTLGGSLGSGIRQEPQLTTSECFDVYTKRFSL